jgi:hypothetical protein
MTDPELPPEDAMDEGPDKDPMAALLKRSLERSDVRPPPLVKGVQARLRKRSRGKFYADGWSTTNIRVQYALIATVMLVFAAVAYFALGPSGPSLE